MIRREWLRYYDNVAERTYRSKIIQSWDTAAKDGAQNDWSVCTTWMLVDKHYYLLDLTRGRYEYPRLRATAIALAERFNPEVILIEDASTGIALARELMATGSIRSSRSRSTGTKLDACMFSRPNLRPRLVHFPRGARFLPELETELLAFPQARTDDQVDSISQALNYKLSTYTLDNIY